ncbi:MAG TPA: sialidase family protein [Gemmatimonadales bacterium]|nr:sialidase family protein [Gemmatimonadales bacterium]
MVRIRYVSLIASLVVTACRELPEATPPSRLLAASESSRTPDTPTWWAKYQYLAKNGPMSGGGPAASTSVGANVDVSNECGPQSETFITVNPNDAAALAAGSNEIFRLPMRAYFSSDGGSRWGAVDVPLPAPLAGTNDTRFGSDPSLAFDTQGNAFYGFIVVFFGAGSGVNGTEMAVARSTDGGRTWPLLTPFSFESGQNHFNDKPIIVVDKGDASPFRDRVYAAWDAASGGSAGGGIRVGRSADDGLSFAVNRADNPSGPGKAIGADPFVAPDGTLYVAWNDYAANTIAFNRSFDGGVTWDAQRIIAPKTLAFALSIPAQSFRGALVYPACDTDRSGGRYRGRLYCSWMDVNAAGNTVILFSVSDDAGTSWSVPALVGHQLPGTDRFNQWLSVDPVTGALTVSYYDTQNDVTGQRVMTDVYLSRSLDGGATQLPDVRVTTVSSNEHDCNGVFPCPGIDYGNQYGDYEGLVSFGGTSHPIWTDSRRDLAPFAGCAAKLAMEEVFSATVTN